jgi:hypothetical protein
MGWASRHAVTSQIACAHDASKPDYLCPFCRRCLPCLHERRTNEVSVPEWCCGGRAVPNAEMRVAWETAFSGR